jgi:hypothetical protein
LIQVKIEMNLSLHQMLFSALLLVFSIVISGSAAATFSGFPDLPENGEMTKRNAEGARNVPPAPRWNPGMRQQRTLTPIVGGTCKIVCDGLYAKYEMDSMKVILPCDSACKVVDLLAEGFTEGFVVAISGPEGGAMN